MKKTLITATVALGLGLFSTPTFATGYVVNGHAASPAEAQLLVSNGVQPGAWVVNGYGITPADRTSTQPATKSTAKKCWYVLDVQLCDRSQAPDRNGCERPPIRSSERRLHTGIKSGSGQLQSGRARPNASAGPILSECPTERRPSMAARQKTHEGCIPDHSTIGARPPS